MKLMDYQESFVRSCQEDSVFKATTEKNVELGRAYAALMAPSMAVKALSIRQPWAWLIIRGGKDIENRSRRTHLRGRIYVHASQGMTRDEYSIGKVMAEEAGLSLPKFEDLERGGIIGSVEITDCVESHSSPWFFGPFGYVLRDPQPLPFQPCRGSLNFFEPQI